LPEGLFACKALILIGFLGAQAAKTAMEETASEGWSRACGTFDV
jgi:hypothetical protein